MINLSNYEDWFLLYADGELTVAEQEAVLEFVKQHPSLQEELDLLLSMRFQPETEIRLNDHSTLTAEYFNELETTYCFEPDLTIQFPDKENLYKRTAAPVISMFRFAAVAASTIVTAGLIWWFVGTNSVDQTLVKTEVNVTPELNKSEQLNILPQTNTTSLDVAQVATTKKQLNFVADVKSVSDKSFKQENIVLPETEDVMQEVVASEKITSPVYNDKPSSNFSQEALQAAHSRMNAAVSNVTISNAVPVNTAPAINTAMLIEAEMDTEKQVPVRGILRKISRTLLGERKEEDDSQKYIQLAVFSIPVQK
jgi:hypothetical protein